MTNSQVCVDASFFVKLAINEDGTLQARELWRGWVVDGLQRLAPSLIWYETTSTIRKRSHRGELATAEARTALEELLRLDLSIVESPDLHRAALDIATQLRQPAAYDSHYIALALQRGCPLWTADSKLKGVAQEVLSEINLVG